MENNTVHCPNSKKIFCSPEGLPGEQGRSLSFVSDGAENGSVPEEVRNDYNETIFKYFVYNICGFSYFCTQYVTKVVRVK